MKKYDLIVVGGGLTGIAASVCAAREGMKVLLCEQGGALGGAMANCLVMPFMRYFEKNPETLAYVVDPSLKKEAWIDFIPQEYGK